jgi:hypothetical protein
MITVTITSLDGEICLSIPFDEGLDIAALRANVHALTGLTAPCELIHDGNRLSDGVKVGTVVKDDDMIIIAAAPSPAAASAAQAPAAAAAPASSSSSAGGMDFSSLFNNNAAASSSSAARAPPRAPQQNNNNGNLIPAGFNFSLPPSQTSAQEFEGMSLDDLTRMNPNPNFFIPLLLSPKHPNLWKELNYHNPQLAAKVKEAGPGEAGIKLWREIAMKGGIASAFQKSTGDRKEAEMDARLRVNEYDEEANKYFGEKIKQKNIDEQYRQMMEDYPEVSC